MENELVSPSPYFFTHGLSIDQGRLQGWSQEVAVSFTMCAVPLHIDRVEPLQAVHRALQPLSTATAAGHVPLLINRVLITILLRLDALFFHHLLSGDAPSPPPLCTGSCYASASSLMSPLIVPHYPRSPGERATPIVTSAEHQLCLHAQQASF